MNEFLYYGYAEGRYEDGALVVVTDKFTFLGTVFGANQIMVVRNQYIWHGLPTFPPPGPRMLHSEGTEIV